MHTKGIFFGLLSALFVAIYMTINKYIYNIYSIDALTYTILFGIVGGIWGATSLLFSLNEETKYEIKTYWKPLSRIGLVGGLAIAVFVYGQQYTSSINAALIVTANIATTMLFSFIILNDRFNNQQWLWIVLLFIGLYIGIVGFGTITFQTGDAIIFIAAVIFGFNNAQNRNIIRKLKHPDIAPDMRLIIAGIIASIIAIFVIKDVEKILLIIPMTLLASGFYWLGLKMFTRTMHLLDANYAIVLNNSQIFFTSIIAVLLLQEGYTIEKFIGSILVLLCVYRITRKKKISIVSVE